MGNTILSWQQLVTVAMMTTLGPAQLTADSWAVLLPDSQQVLP